MIGRGGITTGYGIAVPDKVVTNDDLSKILYTNDEWIVERTGIRERRHGGTTSSLAIEAGLAALTRGICTVGSDGLLTSLDERRHVSRLGDAFRSDDGREPQDIPGDVPTSVNLWGFHTSIWPVFHEAMDASGLDEEALLAEVAAGREIPKSEVLLPEVIATMVDSGTGLPVRVLTTEDKLLGVTHASDLPVVSAELARQVAFGIRPDAIWAGVA